MQKTIILTKSSGMWVTHNYEGLQPDSRVVEAFDTHIVPTPYLESTSVKDVVKALRELNPDTEIFFVEDVSVYLEISPRHSVFLHDFLKSMLGRVLGSDEIWNPDLLEFIDTLRKNLSRQIEGRELHSWLPPENFEELNRRILEREVMKRESEVVVK